MITLVSLDIGGTVARDLGGSVTSRIAGALERPFDEVRSYLQPYKRVRTGIDEMVEVLVDAYGSRSGLRSELTDVLEAAADRACRLRLYDDVQPTLTRLRERGLRTVLLSNVLGAVAPPCGLAEPLSSTVDGVFYSCDIGAAKPERAAFRHVELAMDARPQEILHIGDAAATDVGGAEDAGWSGVFLDRTGSGRRGIANLGELDQFLRAREDGAVVTT